MRNESFSVIFETIQQVHWKDSANYQLSFYPSLNIAAFLPKIL